MLLQPCIYGLNQGCDACLPVGKTQFRCAVCCSVRRLDADQHGNLLFSLNWKGSSTDAEQQPVIAKLLGHSQIQTMARYAHLARDSDKASAARVADSIAGDLLNGAGVTAAKPAAER